MWFPQATVHPTLLNSGSNTEFYGPKNKYKISFLGHDVDAFFLPVSIHSSCKRHVRLCKHFSIPLYDICSN